MDLFTTSSDKHEKTSMSNVLDKLESESKKNSDKKAVVWTLEMAKKEGLVKENDDIRDRNIWIQSYRSFGSIEEQGTIKCRNYLQSKELKEEARREALLEVQKAKISASEYEKKLMKRAQEREMEKQMAEISRKQKRNANVRSYRRVTNIF